MANTNEIKYKYSSASLKVYPELPDQELPDPYIPRWMNETTPDIVANNPDIMTKSAQQIKKALHDYESSIIKLQNNDNGSLQNASRSSTSKEDGSISLNEWLDSCERNEKIKDTPVNFSYNAISSAFMYEIAKRISDEKHSKISSINDSLDEIKKHLCDYELNIDIREPIHFKDCSSDDNLIAIACEVLMLFKNSTKW